MKRILPIIMALVLMLAVVSSCSQEGANTGDGNNKKISVVSTIFPGYDFTRAIAGDQVELTMLLPPGTESHSFEPTAQDVIKIQNSDVFIYVGGDSDAWVDRLLNSMDTTNMKIISMMDLVETVQEEVKEGMEEEHDHSHEEEINPDDIHDRPLSDWAGSWVSIEKALSTGALDEYITHNAEENEKDFATQKNIYAQRWQSDFSSLKITDNQITWNDASAAYRYIGYKLVEGDHGASVWYGFEAEDPSANVPTYLAFSDHGSGGEEQHDDAHELAHFHMRYGNESFEALTVIEDWSPTYFPSDASDTEIAEALSEHSDSDHDAEYDEHVWTSPLNAIRITEHISSVLGTIDQQNADIYQTNTEAYVAKLKDLDAAFRDVVDNVSYKTLIFADRFPFRYFVDEYGLDYYAAFPGCSTETEPSAKTVSFLIDKTKNEGIPAIFHIEFSNEKMADTIGESTGAKKMLLHSGHNITKTDFEDGVTYLDLMWRNVETLKEALT